MRDDDIRSSCFASLDVLKGFHGRPIQIPRRRSWRPDRDRLARRFERFLSAT